MPPTFEAICTPMLCIVEQHVKQPEEASSSSAVHERRIVRDSARIGMLFPSIITVIQGLRAMCAQSELAKVSLFVVMPNEVGTKLAVVHS